MSDHALSAGELAATSGAPIELIHRLVDLGVVPRRDGDRPFGRGDIHRIRLARAFERSGISFEAIGVAIASGRLSFDFVDEMFIYDAPLTGQTFREVADDLGIPLETLTLLYAMWGLPRPSGDDVVREDDAPTFAEWKSFLPPEALNEELLTQGARLFGEATTRLADWGFAVYRTYIEGPMLAAGMSAQATVDATSAFSATGIPMMERQLAWLLRRKLEHNAFQLIVEHVENVVEATGAARAAASSPPAICFVDLSGYTALTEEIGDRAAADRAERLGTLLQELAHGHGGRVVKLLGDGAMLHFGDPAAAVMCALEIVERVGAEGLPQARAGLAAGPVVFQSGDCYGRVVNLAARVMGQAKPGQVLATPEVVGATPATSARFESLGSVQLKGIAAAVAIAAAFRPG